MVVSTIWPVLFPMAHAQTVDTSTGEVGNSSTSASTAPPANPAPTKLVARMEPASPDLKARGEVTFSLAGDGLNVVGRIDGLEANMRYQLAVPPSASVEPPKTEGPVDEGETDEDGATGKQTEEPISPSAGTPDAGGPAAGPPEAGKPDGSFRPGAPGSGTEGTSASRTRASSDGKDESAAEAKLSGALGTLTADAGGGANINLTVRSLTLTTGPDGLQGRTVTLTWMPAGGTESEPTIVARGELGLPGEAEKSGK